MLVVTVTHVRREKTRNEAVARYVATVFETGAVGLLLEYCGQETTALSTREACWRSLSPLLVRLSEEEAAALSEKARAYLVLLIFGQRSNVPQLSPAEKTRVLLVLAAVRDEEFVSLLGYLRVFPSFRELADHLLLESPKS